jgi:hypothetical protein
MSEYLSGIEPLPEPLRLVALADREPPRRVQHKLQTAIYQKAAEIRSRRVQHGNIIGGNDCLPPATYRLIEKLLADQPTAGYPPGGPPGVLVGSGDSERSTGAEHVARGESRVRVCPRPGNIDRTRRRDSGPGPPRRAKRAGMRAALVGIPHNRPRIDRPSPLPASPAAAWAANPATIG